MFALLSLSLPLLALCVDALESPVYSRRDLNSSILGDSQIASAWYAGWHATDFPLANVSWSKYTHMAYAFAVTTPDVKVLSLDESDEALLPQFVATAHLHGVKASLSVGGWTGSRWFSTNVGSAANRTAFVDTVTNLVKKFKLDGIDFDWEFPNRQGLGCNVVNANDTANFLSFLQELRQTSTGANLTLSAATSLKPWNDSSNTPLTDVSGFSHVLDYIAIMNYDVWSSEWSSGAGPNAPLNDSCAASDDQFGSAVSAVNAWTSAGFPANQIVLGVPAYGHSYIVNQNAAYADTSNTMLAAYPEFNASAEKLGDSWDDEGYRDECGVEQGASGVYSYWGLMETGFLNTDGSVKDDIGYRYDNCSQTPYLYNSSSQVMVSYDNVQYFAAKGAFIKDSGLKGFAIWEAGGDYNDMLLDSILSATVNGDPTETKDAPTPSASAVSPTAQSSSNGARAVCASLFWVSLSGLATYII